MRSEVLAFESVPGVQNALALPWRRFLVATNAPETSVHLLGDGALGLWGRSHGTKVRALLFAD
jgi:hypothetical protein